MPAPQRSFDRTTREARPIVIEPGYSKQAEGSALISFGDTKVLCTASVEARVPGWMRGTGQGWVTAEYGMLPRATNTRNEREAARGKQGGRTMEIQRLIGRSLRACIDMKMLGEVTITLDCDVIQADGGTRTASVTGAWVALAQAIEWGQKNGSIVTSPLKHHVAAVSVGMIDHVPLLDLDYSEDSHAGVDFNVVMLSTGQLVEVQGTAEAEPFDRTEMSHLVDLACEGIERLFKEQDAALAAWRAAK